MWHKYSNQSDFQIHSDQLRSSQFPLSADSRPISQGWRGITSALPFAFLLGGAYLGAKTFFPYSRWDAPICRVVEWDSFCVLKVWKPTGCPPGEGDGSSVALPEWAWTRMAITLIQAHGSPPTFSLHQATAACALGHYLDKPNHPRFLSQSEWHCPHRGTHGLLISMDNQLLAREVNNWSHLIGLWVLFLPKLISSLSLVLTIIQSKGIHSLHILQIKYSWLWNESSGFSVSEPS